MSGTPTARSLMESTVILILNQIKANIAAALLNVRTDRADKIVNTDPPLEYFIFEKAIGYRCPAVFVIGDQIDFKLSRGQNHINSTDTVYVSVVLEDRTHELLVLRSYRYCDALHEVLDRQQLITPSQNTKIVVKVTRIQFSEATQKNSPHESIFRKEVMLTLEVEHFEKE